MGIGKTAALALIALALVYAIALINPGGRALSLDLGFYTPVYTFNTSHKPTLLPPVQSCRGAVTGFYTDVDVTVITSRSRGALKIPGSKNILVIDGYVVVTAVSQDLWVYALSLDDAGVLNGINLDLEARHVSYIGASVTRGSINLYFYVEEADGAKRILQLIYSYSRNEFKAEWTAPPIVSINIAYGYMGGCGGPRFVALGSGVNLYELEGSTIIEINGYTGSVEASLRDLTGVYVYGESIILVFNSGGSAVLVSYSNGSIRKGVYRHNGSLLIAPATSHLVVARTEGEGLRLHYLNPETLVNEREVVIAGDVFSVFNADLDGDGFVEHVRLEGYQYVVETTRGLKLPVYWTKLREPIGLSLLTLGERGEGLIAIHRSSWFYEIELLALNRGVNVDRTPPSIALSGPQRGSIVRSPVAISVEASDAESGVFSSRIELLRNGERVYSKVFSRGSFALELDLQPGAHHLIVEAWNSYGYRSVEETFFIVVDNDIAVLNPLNYSVVGRNVTLTIASYAEYNLELYINGSFYGRTVLKPGLNEINVSFNSDGVVYVELKVEETCRTHLLVLTVDSSEPELRVYGLRGGDVYTGVIVFYVYVFDQHLSLAFVKIGGYTVLSTSINGNYTVVFNTLRLTDGPVNVEFYAEDRAGNANSFTYTIEVVNPVELELTVEPPINGAFVSGVLELKLRSNSPEIYVYVDEEMINRFIDEWGVDEELSINTTVYGDGVRRLTIRSVFKGGLVEKEFALLVDNNPPTVDLKLPVAIGGTPWINGSYAPVFNPELNLSYVAAVNSSFFYIVYIRGADRWIEEVTLYINGSVAVALIDGEERPCSFNRNVSLVTYVKVPGSGVYYLRLEARDRSGKRASTALKAIFDFDKPLISVLEPPDGLVTNVESVRFVLVANDNTSRLCALGFSVLDNPVKPDLYRYYPLPNRTIFMCGTPVSFEISFRREGTFYVWFLAVDQSYNYYEKPVKLVIDRSPPRMNYSYRLYGDSLSIIAEATDENGVRSISVYINGSLVYVANETRINVTFTLPVGLSIVEVETTDYAGNKASGSFKVNVTGARLETPEVGWFGGERTSGGGVNRVALLLAAGLALAFAISLATALKRWRRAS